MEITSTQSDGVTILSLNGRFDSYQAIAVSAWMEKPLQSGRLVINLAEVSFVDSSALATLVKGMKNCRQRGGDLHVCNLQNPVRVIFELTRLDKAFRIYGSEAEAVNAFSS